jgi:hypothetical protein
MGKTGRYFEESESCCADQPFSIDSHFDLTKWVLLNQESREIINRLIEVLLKNQN